MIVLGIAENRKFIDYERWIRRVDPRIEIVALSHERQNISELDHCDGLILTGGSDVDPRFYRHKDSMSLVEKTNGDRDEFELTAIRHALDRGVPILGICRGLQVFNVAMGGTLQPHIGEGTHRINKDSESDTRHDVQVTPGSIIHSILGATTGRVNSHHHQAARKTGTGLRVTAKAEEVVEGLEWEDPYGKPFLALVQWHPERMEDFENPLSRGLLERFLKEVEAVKNVAMSSFIQSHN